MGRRSVVGIALALLALTGARLDAVWPQGAVASAQAQRLTPPPPPTTSPSPPPPNPGDTKNCGDFATWAEAKAWFDLYFPYYGDVAVLDTDHDGIPCEALPGAP